MKVVSGRQWRVMAFFDVEVVGDDNSTEWDRALESCYLAPFSGLSWFGDVFAKHFDLSSHNILARNPNGDIVCCLPGVTGYRYSPRTLGPPPLTYAGGFFFKEGVDIDDKRGIFEEMMFFLVERGFRRLRVTATSWSPECLGLKAKNEACKYYTSVLECKGEEALWSNLHRSLRKALRKADRSKLSCRVFDLVEVLEDVFYPVYLLNMRKFGTPPQSQHFFKHLAKVADDRLKLFVAFKDDDIAAILLMYAGKYNVELLVSASVPSMRGYRPIDLVLWEAIKWAVREGKNYVIFGPIKDSGQMQYKNTWHVQVLPVFDYTLHLSRQNEAYIQYRKFVSEINPSIRVMSTILRRISPQQLSKLGPFLRRLLQR